MRFASDVIADNLRAHRLVHRLNQEALAERMRSLGFEQWTQATVSEVERYSRAVSAEELMALALALEVTPADLMDPQGLGATDKYDVLLGTMGINGGAATEWVRDRARLGYDPKIQKMFVMPRPAEVESVSNAITEYELRRAELGKGTE